MSSKCTMNTVILGILCFWLEGCDLPLTNPFEEKNLVWEDSSNGIYDTHANAYCMYGGKGNIVLLHWQGTQQLSTMDVLVILCLTSKDNQHILDQGLAIETSGLFLTDSGNLVRLRKLNPDDLVVSPIMSSGCQPLTYSGQLTGKSNFDEGTDLNWLKFKVKPQKNSVKIQELFGRLEPLLQKEPSALSLLECPAIKELRVATK
ncbi:MAG: hypothetical protein GX455_12680 [Phycisphaerae bacterium]|nr:hypothetical protein [Phycisphaerae bacterium]